MKEKMTIEKFSPAAVLQRSTSVQVTLLISRINELIEKVNELEEALDGKANRKMARATTESK